MFKKPVNPTMEYTIPNTEQRDLMQKLSDDIVKVLERHFELCAPIYNPYETFTMQINVIMKIMVHHFIGRHNTTDNIIPFVHMFLKYYHPIKK